MGDNFSLPEPFKTMFGWIAAIAGVLTSIVGFVLFWQGNKEIVSTVSLATGGISLWASCFYVRLARKHRTKKQNLQNKLGDYLYSKQLRNIAYVGIFAVPIFALIGISGYSWIKNQPSNKTIILVANFDGPDPEIYRVTDFVLEKLSEATQDYPYIKIVPLQQTITVQQGSEFARNLGQDKKAKIVVWGWYGVTGKSVHVSTHFETLGIPSLASGADKNSSDSNENTRPLIEAETFEFQSGLSESISATALFVTGFILYDEGKYNEAIDMYTKALDISPKDEFVNRAQIFGERALAYARLSKFDQALKDANQAVSISPPNNYKAYNQRGLVYFYKGDYSSALKDYEKAATSPDEFSSRYMVGVIHFTLGNDQQAISAFTQALQVNPEFYPALMQRGIVYRALGMKSEARADFEDALSMVKDSEMRELIGNLLASVK